MSNSWAFYQIEESWGIIWGDDINRFNCADDMKSSLLPPVWVSPTMGDVFPGSVTTPPLQWLMLIWQWVFSLTFLVNQLGFNCEPWYKIFLVKGWWGISCLISDDEVKDKSPSPADSDMGIQQWISPLFEINYLSGWSLDVVSGWTRLCSSDVCSGWCQSDKSGGEAGGDQVSAVLGWRCWWGVFLVRVTVTSSKPQPTQQWECPGTRIMMLMTMIKMINEISVDRHNDHRRQEAATPTNTAMRMFQNKDRTGNELLDSSLPTTHQNQVETNLKRSKCRSRHMNNIGKRSKY